MKLSNEIRIRDPFVVLLNDTYYLYGTTDVECWGGPGEGFDAYTSKDLVNWEGPFPVFRASEDFWGKENFWAPEMHFYKGAYYLLASFIAPGKNRGTQILKAENPLGPFIPWSDGAVTPEEWMSLDGTLYINKDGKPFMVFCHEWVQIKDGTMAMMPLTDDLRKAAGKPVTLFKSTDAVWNKQTDSGHVTDGPFLYRTQTDKLIMLWSTNGWEGYTIGYAISDGDIEGPWHQVEKPLFEKDGGHGMIFRDKEGKLRLAIHVPNVSPNERPVFIQIEDTGDGLRLVPEG